MDPEERQLVIVRKMREDPLFRMIMQDRDRLIERLVERDQDPIDSSRLEESEREVRSLRAERDRLVQAHNEELERRTAELRRYQAESEETLRRTLDELGVSQAELRTLKVEKNRIVQEECEKKQVQLVKTERARLRLLIEGEHKRFLKLLADEEPEEKESALHCTVCLEGNLEILLEPCAHISTCSNCTVKLTTCPICRELITEKKRVFISS
jgi:hypothetical protein